VFDEFSPKVVYIKGKHSVVAYTLSRICWINTIIVLHNSLGEEICQDPKHDPWYKETIASLDSSSHPLHFSLLDGNLCYKGCLVILEVIELRHKILYELHDSSYLGMWRWTKCWMQQSEACIGGT